MSVTQSTQFTDKAYVDAAVSSATTDKIISPDTLNNLTITNSKTLELTLNSVQEDQTNKVTMNSLDYLQSSSRDHRSFLVNSDNSGSINIFRLNGSDTDELRYEV